MRFILEYDGAVMDLAGARFEAHRRAAAEVGWSALDRTTFSRLTRTKGRQAVLLPGAKPAKLDAYYAAFDRHLESGDVQAMAELFEDFEESLRRLRRLGSLVLVTLGSNLVARRQRLESAGLVDSFQDIRALDPDARRRPVELQALTDGDRHVVVVAATDALGRTAGAAELVVVGVASGSCSMPRLRQAGADLAYRDLYELADEIAGGGGNLVRAGVLPQGLIQA